MKLRNGFVSNSSSSSFIVEFKNVPKSRKELQDILFGDRQEYHYPYGTKFFSTDDVAAIVWNDMQGGPANKEDIEDRIDGGYPIADHIVGHFLKHSEPQCSDFEYKDSEGKRATDWAAYKKAWDEYTGQFKRFVNWDAVEEGRVFTFEYSDNEGQQQCAMERGNLFENAYNVLKVSNH
jgi:hypothetical protein